jgi:quercetin dioxygenase-like cupin family protein
MITIQQNGVGSHRMQGAARGGRAMGYTLTEAHFTTEEEARSEIEARGWRAITIDLDAAESELHWHDFDAVIYVLEGTVTIQFDDGTVMQCGAGARVDTPAGVVHHDSSTGYRAVVGLAVSPDEMTRPINKSPELLPG